MAAKGSYRRNWEGEFSQNTFFAKKPSLNIWLYILRQKLSLVFGFLHLGLRVRFLEE